MNDTWIWAGVAVATGLAVGLVLSVSIRRLLDRPGRRPSVRSIARPTSAFAFWLAAVAGVAFAVAAASPSTLEALPREVLGWIPRIAVAGLFLGGGYVVAAVTAVTVGRVMAGTSGHRYQPAERIIRVVILGIAAILALSQLGIETTILNIMVAAAGFGVAAALAGLAIAGGIPVARSIAAARTVQGEVAVGDVITAGSIAGTVADIGLTHVTIVQPTGRRTLISHATLFAEPFHIDAGVDEA